MLVCTPAGEHITLVSSREGSPDILPCLSRGATATSSGNSDCQRQHDPEQNTNLVAQDTASNVRNNDSSEEIECPGPPHLDQPDRDSPDVRELLDGRRGAGLGSGALAAALAQYASLDFVPKQLQKQNSGLCNSRAGVTGRKTGAWIFCGVHEPTGPAGARRG